MTLKGDEELEDFLQATRHRLPNLENLFFLLSSFCFTVVKLGLLWLHGKNTPLLQRDSNVERATPPSQH